MELSVTALRSFLAVTEERQFGRAAARLHVTPSSLSELVGRAEKRLGTPLFLRTPRGVELSAAGRELLPLARAVVEASEAVSAWAADRTTPQQGAVRVGVAAADVAGLRTTVLDVLAQRHPGLDVVSRRRSHRREAFAELRAGRLDVAYVPDVPSLPPGLRSMTVGREARLLAVPRGHRFARRASLSIEETNDETFVVVAGSDERAVAWWLVDPRADGSHPVRSALAGDYVDLLDLCAAGRGLGMGTATDAEAGHPGLVFVPLTDAPPIPTALCWRADERNPSVLAYTAAVRQVVEETGADMR